MGRVNDPSFEKFILSVAVKALFLPAEGTVCKLNIFFGIRRNIKILFSVDTSKVEEFAKLTENLEVEVLKNFLVHRIRNTLIHCLNVS